MTLFDFSASANVCKRVALLLVVSNFSSVCTLRMAPSPPPVPFADQLEDTPSAQAFFTLREASLTEIAEMRSLFETVLKETPAAFHPTDVNRVRTDDWQLLRFLQHTSSITDAFERLKDALLWKHSVGLHEKRDEDFPREFYELNGLEVLGHNPESGQLVMWITSKYNRNFSEFKTYMQDFVIHEVEYMDQLAGPYGILIISDAKHVGLFSVDIQLTQFMQDIISKYYPGTIRQTLVTNLSMLLNPIYKLVLAFLDAELRATVKVVDVKKLVTMVPANFVPEEYGGTVKTRVIRLPAESLSFTEMPHIQLTDDQKSRFKALFAALDIN